MQAFFVLRDLLSWNNYWAIIVLSARYVACSLMHYIHLIAISRYALAAVVSQYIYSYHTEYLFSSFCSP